MKIVARGTAIAGRNGTALQSCSFPQLCVLPGGRWICGFRAAPSKAATAGQRSLLTFSDDEGATWSEPVEPFLPPPIEGKPGLFRTVAFTSLGGKRVLASLCWVDCSDPSLPFFNEKTEGLLDTRIFLARSEDDGNIWSQPSRMETAPFDCPSAITGPVLRLTNGKLACQFELNKHYHDPKPWHHSSVLMFSKDEGRTWPIESEILIDQLPAISQTKQKQNMQDAWAEMANFSIGLPTTALTQNGDVLVVYYAGPSADLTDIKWARIRLTPGGKVQE